jgi:hypothetical protein
METRPIFVLLGLLATATAMAQAYRWVDDDGLVHYSDRPVEGAVRIDLSEYSRNTGARLYTPRPATASSDDEQTAASTPFRYESLSIATPGPEETLWNIEGTLNVSLALSPGLQTGHQVRVYFDGKPQMVSGSSFQIQQVYRGVHNVQAEVLDAAGKLMIRSQPNRFYVQQSTVKTSG